MPTQIRKFHFASSEAMLLAAGAREDEAASHLLLTLMLIYFGSLFASGSQITNAARGKMKKGGPFRPPLKPATGDCVLPSCTRG